MNIKILDLERQYMAIREEIEPAVCRCLAGGVYIGGKEVSDFEEQFAGYIGVRHAISVNSGTDALVIALKALGIQAGDEVITTPFTFFATAEAIAMAGAVPVFADVEEDSYNIDPDQVEEKITEKTKGILPVHIFGKPADMKRIDRIAREHGLFVLEDACQAAGASEQNKMAGNLADAGCFSFFPTKNLGAFGDAGMITTNDDNTAVLCRALKQHGMGENGARARSILEGTPCEALPDADTEGLYNPCKYYNYLIAHNSRMDTLQAVVLSVKLKHLDEYNRKRAEHASFYHEELESISQITLPSVQNGQKAVWHQYAIRCKEKEQMVEWLGQQGICCGVFYPVPLHLQKAFAYLQYRSGDFPVAEKLCRETVCLPVYPELTMDELAVITGAVKAFYDGKSRYERKIL